MPLQPHTPHSTPPIPCHLCMPGTGNQSPTVFVLHPSLPNRAANTQTHSSSSCRLQTPAGPIRQPPGLKQPPHPQGHTAAATARQQARSGLQLQAASAPCHPLSAAVVAAAMSRHHSRQHCDVVGLAPTVHHVERLRRALWGPRHGATVCQQTRVCARR